ncbi:MAG: hypothetical protein DMG67_15805 [Acidobacteria bacterium]|nr:MAG: hypothetical protein DMG67_15805 [Acidobacteriota bacterium]
MTQNLQPRGFRLAEALHREHERILTGFGLEHAANHIALIGPEMQQAFAVIGRDRVAGNRQIKNRLAVFKDHSGRRSRQECFEIAHEGFRLHEISPRMNADHFNGSNPHKLRILVKLRF